MAGRFEGYPPGFLEAIDKAVRVMPRDRIQSATDWLDWIRIGEEGGPLPESLIPAPRQRSKQAPDDQAQWDGADQRAGRSSIILNALAALRLIKR